MKLIPSLNMAFVCFKHHMLNIFTVLFILQALPVNSQVHVHGYVRDSKSGEFLPGVHVVLNDGNSGSVSNRFGFFSLQTVPGPIVLETGMIGYTSEKMLLDLQADTLITFYLQPGYMLGEVAVKGYAISPYLTSRNSGYLKLIQSDLSATGSLLGEPDLMKVLQNFPGINQGKEGSSEIYVRGGSADQNLILLDGAPVYNLNHAFGLLSIFNVEAIKEVSVYKGGMPARYGGRLSSVVDVQVKDGNNNERKSSYSVSTLGATLMLEGPIVKRKSNYMVSLRRSWVDLLYTGGLLLQGSQMVTGVSFYDVNAKATFNLNERNRLWVSAYTGNDRFYVRMKDGGEGYSGFSWGNQLASCGWSSVFRPNLFSNFQVHYSSYFDKEKITYEDKEVMEIFRRNSVFNELGARSSIDWQPVHSFMVTTGIESSMRVFNPASIRQIARGETVEGESGKLVMYDIVLYNENLWTSGLWRINAGFRHEMSFVDDQEFRHLLPRMSVSYQVLEGVYLKGGAMLTSQTFFAVPKTTMNWPGYFYVPSGKRLKPQKGWLVSVGTNFSVSRSWNLDIEGYLRRSENLPASYGTSSASFAVTNWQEFVKMGQGKAAGIEVLSEFRQEMFRFNFGYTISKAQVRFDEYNNGQWFEGDYSRMHDLVVTPSWEFVSPPGSTRLLSFSFTYRTGTPFMLPSTEVKPSVPPILTKDMVDFSFIEVYSGPNNARMPDYHRLDVSYEVTKTRERGERTLAFGVYNLYNRMNAYLIYYDDTKGYQQLTLFPAMPYITYRRRF